MVPELFLPLLVEESLSFSITLVTHPMSMWLAFCAALFRSDAQIPDSLSQDPKNKGQAI